MTSQYLTQYITRYITRYITQYLIQYFIQYLTQYPTQYLEERNVERVLCSCRLYSEDLGVYCYVTLQSRDSSRLSNSKVTSTGF